MRNLALRTRTMAILIALVFVAPTVWAQELTEIYNGREVVAGEVLVKLRDGQPPVLRIASDPDIRAAKRLARGDILLVQSRGKNVERLLQEWRADPGVEWVEPNYILRASATIPNDEFFNLLWGMHNTGQNIQGSVGIPGADISATDAWDITTGSRANVVGIIDSGVDYTHPDLAANMWSAPSAFTVTIGGQSITCPAGSHGFNAINRTCNPMDDNGHGTHVAGTIGAVGNNGIGVTGVNWTASMIGIKFLNAAGNGSTANAIDAIHFAIQVKQQFGAAANIRVLNNSWGGGGFSTALRDAIQLASDNNILFVVAAGNENRNNDAIPSYPANYNVPNIISVLSTTNRDARSGFSNWGATTVHLGAPGSNIGSTWPGGGYVYSSGTSMAAPHVSGAAALVLSVCNLTTTQLKSNLLSTVDPVAALAPITITGGRLNVHAALLACAGGGDPDFTLTATPPSRTIEPGGSTSYTISLSPLNGFNATVSLSVSGLPAGATGSFVPASISGGSGSSTLNVTTSGSVAPGTYPLTIRGASGALERTASATLVIEEESTADFTIDAFPASRTIAPGATTGFGVNIIRGAGFTAPVSFSVSGLPAGVSHVFSAQNTTGNQTILTIFNTAGAAPGSYELTITGTSGSASQTDTVTLNISGSGFTLSATPPSQAIDPGQSASYAVSISRTGGFTGTVSFSVSGLPSGASGAFSPASTSGNSSTLTISTTGAVAPGTYGLTITGASGALTRTANVALTINSTADFSLSATPPSQTVTPGESAAYGITIARSGGFSGTVAFSASGLPAGASASFSPSSTGGNSSTLTVATTSGVAPGSYSVTITGVSGAVSRTTNVTLVVESGGGGGGDFTLTVQPASRTIAPGATTNFSITIARGPSATGPISFSVDGLPGAGISSATFLMANPTAPNAVLRIVTTGAVPPGTYNLTITGTINGGSVTAPATLVVR